MDSDKPNWRPSRKNDQTSKRYQRKIAQASQPSTLTISTHGSAVTTAPGEVFAANVEYSLNKGRRWALTERDFTTANPTEEQVVLARGTSNTTRARVDDSRTAFKRALKNEVAEDDDFSASQAKKTTRKDRKHFKQPKGTQTKALPNSYSSDVYAAAAADVLVSVTHQPSLRETRPHKPNSRHNDIEARTHKTRALTALSM